MSQNLLLESHLNKQIPRPLQNQLFFEWSLNKKKLWAIIS